MQNVPKIVRDRLQAAAPAVNHPDADLLTAFVERSLPDRERTVVLDHLARCGDCRDVVALALPEIQSVQTTVRPSPSGWFTWPALRWGFVTAGVVAIVSLGLLQFQRRSQPQTAASATKQAVPVEIAANEPKKEVARFVAPVDKSDKTEKLQAPATPGFADSVNGPVAADSEKKNEFHGAASPARIPPPSAAPVAGGIVGATIGGPLPHGPRVLNQYQQQSNVQNQIPASVPPAFAKQRPVENDRVPAASEKVEVAGAAPLTAKQDANRDIQLAENRSVPDADSAYSRAKELPGQTAQEPGLRRLEGRAAPGQIGGYVVDPSGAVVSNAQVTIIPSRGKPTTAITDARGEWLIAGLPTGSYKAQAAAPGFKTTVVDLNYDANQPKAFAFTLSPGSVSETVDVAAGAMQVQTETNSVGNASNSKAVSQIAINGRNSTDLSPALQPRWAVNAAGALQRSFDKGSSWQTVDVNASGASLELSAKTSRAKSKDAGKALKRDTAALIFRAVYAAGADVWAGGSAGALYHSQDVGNHWTRVTPASGGSTLTGDILTLEFTDAQHGQLSTSTSEVWITADAGQTWQKQ